MYTLSSKLVPLFLITALLSGCSGLLRASPIQESPQLEHLVSAGEGLKADEEKFYPFNHAWRSSEECAPQAETSVYVHAVDTSRIDSASLRKSRLSPKQISKLAEYARKTIARAFEEKKSAFHVVDAPPAHGRVVELSLVEVTGTDVARNVLGTALGVIVPGGGLISVRSSGTIAVEGAVKEAKTGKPLFVFADRQRGRIAPFSFNDFTELSHARRAIDDWSEEIVESCAASPGTRVDGSSAITLLPL